jgi:hypothetical protein
MSTDIEPTFWTLENKSGGNPLGNPLTGLHIRKIDGGYELLNRDPRLPRLALTDRTAPPFSFNGVSHAGQTWDIYVFTLDPASKRSGMWSLPNTGAGGEGGPDTGPENGDYTAQAGGSLDADQAAASSAKA